MLSNKQPVAKSSLKAKWLCNKKNFDHALAAWSLNTNGVQNVSAFDTLKYMVAVCAAKRFLFGFDSDNSQHRPNDAYVYNFCFVPSHKSKQTANFICVYSNWLWFL